MQTIYTDVLVIGAGLAGERAAIEVAQAGFSAICLSIVPARRSHSAAARGGMQAVLESGSEGGDCPAEHFADTVRASDWGCDQEVARIFADLAPAEARRLAFWGVPWDRVPAGKGAGRMAGRRCGGASRPRARRAGRNTGHAMLFAMDDVSAKLGVEVHDKTEAVALLHDGYTCYGVVARCLRTGELNVYLARATVIASGGFGRIFGRSTAGLICDGGAQAAIIETGLVPMGDMEAVQFTPLALAPTDILLPDSCLSAGGLLKDVDGGPVLAGPVPERPAPAGRDAITRRMLACLRAGRGVEDVYGRHLWLDLRYLGEEGFQGELATVRKICTTFLGLDPAREPIPVRPAQHFCLGGVRTDRDGHAYGLKGLFACGEAACWDLHGFGRLDGNSLAEAVVAGGIVGRKIAEYLQGVEAAFHSAVIDAEVKKQEERIKSLILCKAGTENVFKVRAALGEALDRGAGASRSDKGLAACIDELEELLARARRVGLKSDGKGVNPELSAALRIAGQVKLALMVACGAQKREETRGCHFREDFPERDDGRWMVRTLAFWKNEGDDLPTLEYEPATRSIRIPPEGLRPEGLRPEGLRPGNAAAGAGGRPQDGTLKGGGEAGAAGRTEG